MNKKNVKIDKLKREQTSERWGGAGAGCGAHGAPPRGGPPGGSKTRIFQHTKKRFSMKLPISARW